MWDPFARNGPPLNPELLLGLNSKQWISKINNYHFHVTSKCKYLNLNFIVLYSIKIKFGIKLNRIQLLVPNKEFDYWNLIISCPICGWVGQNIRQVVYLSPSMDIQWWKMWKYTCKFFLIKEKGIQERPLATTATTEQCRSDCKINK